MTNLNKENQNETERIIEKTIQMYFDEKQKREKPKDKGSSYFMTIVGGAAALYIIYQMSVLFNNF